MSVLSAAAWIFSFSGENPPDDSTAWHIEDETTRAKATSAPASGVRLWLRACLVNAKAQPGPMSAAVSTSVQLVSPPPTADMTLGVDEPLARAA